MRMVDNGILVTTVSPGEYVCRGARYRGPGYGKPWPLQDLELVPASAEAAVVEQVREAFYTMVRRDDGLPSVPVTGEESLAPYALRNRDVITRYIAACARHSIPIRALLCATTAPEPRMDQILADRVKSVSTFLGYDYVSYSFEFSAVLADLFWIPATGEQCFPEWVQAQARAHILDSLSRIASRLDDVGLFDTETDLDEYIAARWRIAQQTGEEAAGGRPGTLLEDGVELYPCAVWELPTMSDTRAGELDSDVAMHLFQRDTEFPV